MTNHLKVALVGPKGTGKTTFARALQDGFGFSLLSFADPIKFSMMTAINCFLTDQGIPPHLTLAHLREHKEAFRLGMQWLGTDIVRDLCGRPTHWIDNLLRRVHAITHEADEAQRFTALVVDDVRFVNEAEALKREGFDIIRLYRPHGSSGFADAHKSEQEHRMIVPDLVLNIGGSPEDTQSVADDYMANKLETLLTQISWDDYPLLADAIDRGRASEIKQALRQIGGISGVQAARRSTGTGQWSLQDVE